MRNGLIIGFALLVLAGIAAYGSFRAPPLQQRALAAYEAGDYAKALPLLKQWATTPEVRNNRDQQKLALAYIYDSEQKLKPTAPGQAAATPAGPQDPAQLLAQAQAAANAQAINGD